MTSTDFNTDSAILAQTLARASATFQTQNSFGSARDPSSKIEIHSTAELSDAELAVLFINEHLCQRICTLFPQEASQHWLRYTIGSSKRWGSFGLADQDIQSYLNSKAGMEDGLSENLSMTTLSSLFYEAALNARLFGCAYLLLGIDDGEEWDQPVNAGSIKSFRWITPIYHTEISPANNEKLSNPSHYQLNYSNQNNFLEGEVSKRQVIHKSRVLPFYGVRLTELVARHPRPYRGRHVSVLQGVWRSMARVSQTFDAAAYLVRSSSFMDYALKGLSQIQDKSVQDIIESRMLSVMMSIDMMKAVVRDAENEQVNFASRPMGGVREILDALLDQVSYNTDVPRFKLFESSEQRGLSGGDKSKAERFLWSQVLDSWRSQHWKDHFLYLGKIASLSKDFKSGGKLVRDLGVELPSSLQVTPQEELEMRKLHMETMAIAKSNEFLNPFEIRTSTYAGNQWSFNVTLDERVTKRMEESAIVEPETPATDQPASANETELEQFDSGDRADDATRAQKKLQWKGFTIGLQYLPFQLRHGRMLTAAYGFVEKTKGADGMAVDVYVGTDLESDRIFVVDQHVNGQFDEHKFIIGVRSLEEARQLFLSAMPPEFLGAIRETTIQELEDQRS